MSAFDSEPVPLRNAASTSSPCASVVAKDGSAWSSADERVAIRNNGLKVPILSIYRNKICNMYRYGVICRPKPGGSMDFDLSQRSEQWRRKLQAFFDAEVLPRHRTWLEHTASHLETPPFMAELQRQAPAAGFWNLGLPVRAAREPGAQDLHCAKCPPSRSSPARTVRPARRN